MILLAVVVHTRRGANPQHFGVDQNASGLLVSGGVFNHSAPCGSRCFSVLQPNSKSRHINPCDCSWQRGVGELAPPALPSQVLRTARPSPFEQTSACPHRLYPLKLAFRMIGLQAEAATQSHTWTWTDFLALQTTTTTVGQPPPAEARPEDHGGPLPLLWGHHPPVFCFTTASVQGQARRMLHSRQLSAASSTLGLEPTERSNAMSLVATQQPRQKKGQQPRPWQFSALHLAAEK